LHNLLPGCVIIFIELAAARVVIVIVTNEVNDINIKLCVKMSVSLTLFQFAADPMILKVDQAISDSFSAYFQIAVHTLCSFSHNF
jgi:hypothetical protein